MSLLKFLVILLIIEATRCEPETFDLSQYPLKYVFEIVRHGARAPIMNDTERFGSEFLKGQLTPQGMR